MNELLPQVLFYANVLWQRRWVALAISWVMCAFGWTYVATIPSEYQSTGRIYVDTATILSPLLQGLTVDSNIQSEIDVMQSTLLSRPNLIRVAQMTDLDVTATTEQQMEQLLDTLRANTEVRSTADDLFSITYEGSDPSKARDVVQALITLFVESNLGQNRQDMDAAADFLDRQIRDYEVKLVEAEERAAEFRRANASMLSAESGPAAALARAQADLLRLEEGLKEAETQRSVLQSELLAVPEFLELPRGEGPPLSFENRIIEVEAQLEQLLSVYTDRHPDVIALNRRLETLRRELEAENAAALEFANANGEEGAANANGDYREPNPLYDLLRSRSIDINATVEVLRRQIAEKRGEVAELQVRADAVPFVQAEFSRLDRDYGVIQARYQSLLERREAARISQDRDAQADKVQFRVIDPPEVPIIPSGPVREILFAGATVAGLGSGAGVALLLALLNMTYATAGRLSNELGYPVVGSIMRISELNRRRRRPISFTIFFVLLLALPLALGVILQIESTIGFGRLLETSEVGGSAGELFRTLARVAQSWVGRLPGM